VGDAEGLRNGLNRAFVSRRQPGSAIKPFIYAAALERGIPETRTWSDEAVAYDGGNGHSWTPRNYGGERFGELSLRQALAHSGNVITVKVLETVGVPAFLELAGRAGLPLHARNGLSLALGTDEVALTELVQAYTALAAGGTRAQARTIQRIYDRRRQVWIENPPAGIGVMSPAAAFITTQMLKDVLVYGTAKSLRSFGEAHAAAGKTGTTDGARDAWFVGFTPNLVTGVWVGHDRPRPEGRGFTGGAIAAPIWEQFMKRAVAARPSGDFPRPDTVKALTVDADTGLPAREGCPVKREAFFASGTEPTEPCPRHEGEPVPLSENPPETQGGANLP